MAHLLLFTGVIESESVYKILEQFSGVIRGQLLIPIEEDITNGWEATLTFDQKVTLHVNNKLNFIFLKNKI